MAEDNWGHRADNMKCKTLLEEKKVGLTALTSLAGELASAYSAACANAENDRERACQANMLFQKLMDVADFVIKATETKPVTTTTRLFEEATEK